jgi:ABC-type bacteriocin/lantibiotic exporter with double-glycine peptidase domain
VLKSSFLWMGAALVFMQLASLAQQYLLSFAAVRIDAALLDFLSRQLLSLPMSYFNTRRTGDIQRRLDGARQVRLFAVQFGVGGLLSLVTLVGAVAAMAIYSPGLALVFLATLPLYVGLMYFSSKVLRPLFADIEESQGKYASHQIDAIKGIEAVKAASAELTFRDAMLNEFLGVSRKMFRSNFVLMSYDTVLQSIGLISTVLFLWAGAYEVLGEPQDHLAAWLRASALDEADVFWRDLGVEREIELTDSAPLTPLAQQVADRPGSRNHAATIVHKARPANYLAGNRDEIIFAIALRYAEQRSYEIW